MAIEEYARIEADRRRAFKRMRSLYDLQERAINEQLFEELSARRVQYLHALLSQLPFRWHVEHAYTPRETALYGGADHIVLDEDFKLGRVLRRAGDTLARPRGKFWGLARVEDERLPSSLADIKCAERLVAGATRGD